MTLAGTPRRSLGLCLTLLVSGCLSTREGSLGIDQPPLEVEPDAGIEDPTDDESDPGEPTDAGERPVVIDAGGAAAQARDAAPQPRDTGAVVEPKDAAVEGCVLNGHSPFDGFPTPVDRDRDRDGGRSPLFDDPPSLPPIGFEAGVPPFCCTLSTPWFCAPPLSTPPSP